MAGCSPKARPPRWRAIRASRPSISGRASMPDVLKVDNLSAGYDQALVLRGISFSIPEGQSMALLGRNGAGKTTLINSIVGVTRYRGGSIALDGRDVPRLRPDQRALAGVGWVPQERNIFKSLPVAETLPGVAKADAVTAESAVTRCSGFSPPRCGAAWRLRRVRRGRTRRAYPCRTSA